MRREPAGDKIPGRDRLIAAAIRLFGQNGFGGTSVRDIATEAGVSWALIRAHFGTKEGLREAAEAVVVETYLNLVVEAMAATSNEGLMATVEAHREEYAAFQDAVYFLRRAVIDNRPISYVFLNHLLDSEENGAGIRRLRNLYPQEQWLQDPLPALASRIGYILLAPFILERLGRNVFSVEELRLRNANYIRRLSLAVKGLSVEQASTSSKTPMPNSAQPDARRTKKGGG